MEAIARNWWILALQGVVAILVGILILSWPGITLQVLLVLFGAFALVYGAFSLLDAWGRSQRGMDWWPWLLRGLVGVGIGIVALVWPGVTAAALVILIALWAITTGVLEIIAAIQLRDVIANEWILAVVGVLSLLFGLLLLANPLAGALALVLLIGAYFIILGVLLLFVAYQVRGLRAVG